MSYFRTCPYCEAHLDPEEKCDCKKEIEETSNLYLSTSEECEDIEEFISEREEESL